MRRTLVLVAVLGGSAAAQEVIDPAPFELLPAARETGFPFGYPQRDRVRYQEVHDGLLGQPLTVQGVALRRSPRTGGATGAFSATVTLALSTSPRTAATISDTFADNRGSDEVVLLAQQRVSFPPTADPAGTLQPFEFVLAGNQPFVFGGTGPLCIDLTVHDHDGTDTFTFDLFQAGQTHAAVIGDACGGADLTTTFAPGEAVHTASGLPADVPVLFLLGLDLEQAQGTPLPLDLASFGAPGCTLYLAPLAILPDFADPQGVYERRIDVSGLAPGAFYACQVAAVQPGLNALGMVLTQANLSLPDTPRVAGRVWNEDLSAATGQAQPVFALVVRLF